MYQKAGLPLPELGEKTFLRHPQIGRISVFVHGAYDAFIMVAASSQRKAYLLANSLRAVMACAYGNVPLEQPSGYLIEMPTLPTPDMTVEDLADLINRIPSGQQVDNIMLRAELRSGSGVDHIHLDEACRILSRAFAHTRVLEALMHLDYSRHLVWGFMVGSFYESHYSLDRRNLTRYQLERIYLENRFRYDSAFVSSFRGIECLLGKPHFRKPEIRDLLAGVDRSFGTSFATSRHRSWHEVFSSGRRWWKYDEIIQYYLDLRNAVSAHGNPSPPHIVMEDQVFEVQYLLQGMIMEILHPNDGVEE